MSLQLILARDYYLSYNQSYWGLSLVIHTSKCMHESYSLNIQLGHVGIQMYNHLLHHHSFCSLLCQKAWNGHPWYLRAFSKLAQLGPLQNSDCLDKGPHSILKIFSMKLYFYMFPVFGWQIEHFKEKTSIHVFSFFLKNSTVPTSPSFRGKNGIFRTQHNVIDQKSIYIVSALYSFIRVKVIGRN